MTSRLDNRTYCNHSTSKENLARSAQDIASPDRTHGAEEATDIVDRSHRALHCRGRMAEGLQEVFVDQDVAEDTLVVAVED